MCVTCVFQLLEEVLFLLAGYIVFFIFLLNLFQTTSVRLTGDLAQTNIQIG